MSPETHKTKMAAYGAQNGTEVTAALYPEGQGLGVCPGKQGSLGFHLEDCLRGTEHLLRKHVRHRKNEATGLRDV